MMFGLVPVIRRYPIAAFTILACAFSWLAYVFAWFGIGAEPEVMPLGPLLAAAVVTSCQGRAALRTWGRSLRQWSTRPWLYAVAALTPIALHVLIVVINHLFGAPLPTTGQLSGWMELPATFLFMLVMVGLGEEAGWTAFAAPILLRRHGLFGAWAALSTIRLFWHLPLILGGQLPWVLAVSMVGFQLIVLKLLNRSDGRWALAAVWHAMVNTFGGAFFFTMVNGADKDRLGLLMGVVYLLAGLVTLIPIGRGHGHGPKTSHLPASTTVSTSPGVTASP